MDCGAAPVVTGPLGDTTRNRTFSDLTAATGSDAALSVYMRFSSWLVITVQFRYGSVPGARCGPTTGDGFMSQWVLRPCAWVQ